MRQAFDFPEGYKNIEAVKYRVEDKEVFAFVGYPSTPMPKGGYPAAVLVHGGGGTAFFEWVKIWTDRGYAAVSPDFDAQEAADLEHRRQHNKNGGPKGYGAFSNNESIENAWVLFSVKSISSAYDFLNGGGKINPDKVILNGISWGGFLALIAAGRDNRFNALSVVYSSGFISDSDFGVGRNFIDITAEQKEYYDKHFDPRSYAANIACPTLFIAGADDTAFTVHNRKRTSDLIKSPKSFSYRKSFYHDHDEGWNALETIAFANEALLGKKDTAEVVFINLVYTTEDVAANGMCNWQSKKFLPDKEIKIPQAARAYFLERHFSNGLIFSTDCIIKGE